MIKWFGRQGLVGQAGAGARPWTYADLFKDGEAGWHSDAFDISTLFLDTAGTDPVTTVAQSVARQNDKSPNGINATQATQGARPTYQGNYVLYDLDDDVLSRTAPAFTGQIFLATTSGVWFDDIVVTAGAWDTGPTTYTDGPDGLLNAVAGEVVGQVVREGSFTDTEISKMRNYYRRQGVPSIWLKTALLEDESGPLITESGETIYLEVAYYGGD